MRTVCLFTVLGCVFCTAAHGADLWEVYQLALTNDPQYQQAKAQHDATLENKPIAVAGLLPQLTVQASRSIDRINGNEPVGFSDTGPIQGEEHDKIYNTSYTVQLTQPIFHWDQWEQLGQADAQVAQAEASYEAARQNLIVRSAGAYFNLLAARDTLASTRASKASTATQLEQAKKKYHVGLSAITDVQEARAAYDRIIASEISAERSLDNARDALRAIIGEHLATLAEPGGKMPLKPPVPDNAGQWEDQALKQNPTLIANRFAAKAADKNVDIQAAAHYPTLDLVLDHSKTNENDELAFLNQAYTERTNVGANRIMLQLRWSIFSGGATFARTRQAKHQYHAAQDRVVLAARQTIQNTRDAYRGVITGIAQVKALRHAVDSGQTSLKATQEGLKVGTRTTIDVLTTRQNLLNAQTNYAQSRYTYLTSTLQLKQAAGVLNAADVKRLNGFLNKIVPVNVAPVSANSEGTMP